MKKSILFTLLAMTATASCQLNRMDHFHIKNPAGNITVSTNLGDPKWPQRMPVPQTFFYHDLQHGEIRIGEVRVGDKVTMQLDSSASPQTSRVRSVASSVRDLISMEFGLGFLPGFAISIVHCTAQERVSIAGAAPLAQGSFAGIPAPDGQITAENLGWLITILAHEYSEAQLVWPDNLNCALYANSRYNRWVGEGVAELITSLCEKRVLDSGVHFILPEETFPPLDIASLPAFINLSRWGSQPSSQGSGEENYVEQRLQYRASEYMVWLWYQGALENGIEFPIAELAKWIGYRSPGPSRKSLVRWMEQSSGVALASKLESVSLAEVLEYHHNKFEVLPVRPHAELEPSTFR